MPVEVDQLMRQIEDDVRHLRRKRLLARGGADEYRNPALYSAVDDVLRRAIDARQHDALLLAQARLARLGVSAAEWQTLEQAAREEVAQAVAAADAAAWPADEAAFTDVVTVGADRWQG